MLLPEGELARRANKHKIDWPGLVFQASADNEPFVDVEFVTLKQHCLDIVMVDAVEHCTDQNIHGDQDKMLQSYLFEHHREVFTLREFVSCHYHNHTQKLHVRVGINVDKIDDISEDYGLSLVEKVDDFSPGAFYEFGKLYSFKPTDLLS